MIAILILRYIRTGRPRLCHFSYLVHVSFHVYRPNNMTRGRKKDLTIPPSRSLVQQRDYRARKASYIASLEERCRKVEEENAHLREELRCMRAQLSIPAVLRPETVCYFLPLQIPTDIRDSNSG